MSCHVMSRHGADERSYLVFPKSGFQVAMKLSSDLLVPPLSSERHNHPHHRSGPSNIMYHQSSVSFPVSLVMELPWRVGLKCGTGPVPRVSSMASSFPLRHRPFRVLYILFSLATLFVKLLGWTILFLVPFARPKPSWSFKRALIVSIRRHFCHDVGM